MLPISVCLIAKNEEKYIDQCLRRLAKYDWEIIVVDTGSTDRTREIALTYTPCVFPFEWVNDFSAARNYSISRAHHDYILVVDCDEYLQEDAGTLELIQNLTQQIQPGQAGVFTRLSPTAGFSPEGSDAAPVLIHEHIARFFHRSYVHYTGSIHEQLAPISGGSLSFVRIPLTFYHVGYEAPEVKTEKASRNISMLEASLKAAGPDPYLYFQLGQSYFGLSDYSNALPCFESALAMEVNEKEEYVQTLMESYGYCLLYLNRYEEALSLEGVYSIFSGHADFVFLMGLIYMNNAMFDKAIHEFEKAAALQDYAVEGVNSYLAYYNAGVIYECTGCPEKALRSYHQCGSYSPALERISSIKETLQ